MQVLLIQVDGKLPNLALMKLAHWHRSQGHTVTLTKRRSRHFFDPTYDRVYVSAIFSESAKFFPQIKTDWPNAIFGGTGTTNPQTVESIIGRAYEFYDYQDYPTFKVHWIHETRMPPQLHLLCSSRKSKSKVLENWPSGAKV
jgi:hypothetical protein